MSRHLEAMPSEILTAHQRAMAAYRRGNRKAGDRHGAQAIGAMLERGLAFSARSVARAYRTAGGLSVFGGGR